MLLHGLVWWCNNGGGRNLIFHRKELAVEDFSYLEEDDESSFKSSFFTTEGNAAELWLLNLNNNHPLFASPATAICAACVSGIPASYSDIRAQVQGAKKMKKNPGSWTDHGAVPIRTRGVQPKSPTGVAQRCLLSLLKGSFAHFRCQVNGGRCGSAGGGTCDLPSWKNRCEVCEVTKKHSW